MKDKNYCIESQEEFDCTCPIDLVGCNLKRECHLAKMVTTRETGCEVKGCSSKMHLFIQYKCIDGTYYLNNTP